MEKITNYSSVEHLISQIRVAKVYPLSIVEGFQSGEIFADDADDPKTVFVWHSGGVAHLEGKYNEEMIREIRHLMSDPLPGHMDRLVLQAKTQDANMELFRNDTSVREGERFDFDLSDETMSDITVKDVSIELITPGNYDRIKGRFIPSFYWESKEAFLKNGFGCIAVKDGVVAASAFAAAVSRKYVSIGVETYEDLRGKGYGMAVSAAMVRESLKRGITPLWGCDVLNEASRRLACLIGFKVTGTHPEYTLRGDGK